MIYLRGTYRRITLNKYFRQSTNPTQPNPTQEIFQLGSKLGRSVNASRMVNNGVTGTCTDVIFHPTQKKSEPIGLILTFLKL